MALIKVEPEDFVAKVPKYPDFPYTEYKSRIDRVKRLMAETKIDATVLWWKHNIRYFFGFQTGAWELVSLQPAVGIIAVDRDPILIVPEIFSINAQMLCWTKDIRLQARANEVAKERELPLEVANVLKEIGCAKKNIALEKGLIGAMTIPRPLNDIESFIHELPNAKFVDGDKIIWDCRMIKSPLEIDRIRRAAHVVQEMHSAVITGFKPGMSEIDLEKIVRHVEVDAGDFQGMDSLMLGHEICSVEREGIYDNMALEGVVIASKDDYLMMDLQHRCHGYWADMARVFQVSTATEEVKRKYELCSAGLDNAATVMRAGVKANEVYRAAIKPIEDAGLPVLGMAGHGIGLEVHEPPAIDGVTETVLQEGMAIAIEVWILSLKRLGGSGLIGIEEQFVVTDAGCERIEGFDKSIIQVSHLIP